MRRLAIAFAAFTACAAALPAEAQTRRTSEPLVIEVRPRSFLEPGNVVAPGSMGGTMQNYVAIQNRSYALAPPWINQRDRFGEGSLPDPLTGPFVGARNPIGPVDYAVPRVFVD